MALLDDLFGAGEAQDDIRQGARESNAALDTGAEGARQGIAEARQDVKKGAKRGRGALTAGRDSALDFLGADIEAGDSARENLLSALGLRGLEAQQGFFGNFQNDPGFQASLDAGIEAIDQSAAARGGVFSGGTQKDLFSFGQRFQTNAFQDRLDRLTGLSSLGSQARTNAANVSSGTGANLANLEVGLGDRLAGLSSEGGNLEFGLGQLKANTATNQANAIADTRGTGLNNLIGLAAAGARAAAGFQGAT